MDTAGLDLQTMLPIRAENAGLFISQGRGQHAARVIDTYELIFVRQGRLGMFEEDRQFEVTEGQTLLLWPGRRHGGTLEYPSDLRFYWLHFSLAVQGTQGEPMHVPQLTTIHRPDRLTELFRQFIGDQESGRLNPLSASLLVMLMLSEVAHAEAYAEAVGEGGLMLAQRAHTMILAQYAEEISTSEIARALDCNPDYLGRVFAAVFAMPITETIHRRRIYHARMLLLDTDTSIEQIAAACGFTDVGYFRRLFRRYEGMPPLAYRRLYARIHINTS